MAARVLTYMAERRHDQAYEWRCCRRQAELLYETSVDHGVKKVVVHCVVDV